MSVMFDLSVLSYSVIKAIKEDLDDWVDDTSFPVKYGALSELKAVEAEIKRRKTRAWQNQERAIPELLSM